MSTGDPYAIEESAELQPEDFAVGRVWSPVLVAEVAATFRLQSWFYLPNLVGFAKDDGTTLYVSRGVVRVYAYVSPVRVAWGPDFWEALASYRTVAREEQIGGERDGLLWAIGFLLQGTTHISIQELVR